MTESLINSENVITGTYKECCNSPRNKGSGCATSVFYRLPKKALYLLNGGDYILTFFFKTHGTKSKLYFI